MPPFYVDVTTSWSERGRHPHGTTRVERRVVDALARHADPQIVFFRREETGYVRVAASDALAAATGPTRAELGREPQPGWWRHPLVMRARAVRRRLRVGRQPGGGPAPEEAADPFVPRSTLFFPGEHDRHDFARLTALKRAKQLRFVFLFYDLLRVLDDGDARLQDTNTGDLPQSDFIAREADLVLPISQFSAGAFRRHLARRGVAGPAIIPVRLAGEVSAGQGWRVPGLEPGRFVLTVGDVVHRKNHGLLVSVWEALGERAPMLVIAGRVDREGDELAARIRRTRRLRGEIRILPNLGDESLVWLYRNCRFTLFPSFLEGFGLPVAKSLAYGKVCLASSAAAIPEAGQGMAITLDPRDAEAWAEAIVRLAPDDALGAEEARVKARFRPVTWNDTVDQVLEAVRRLSGVAGRGAPA